MMKSGEILETLRKSSASRLEDDLFAAVGYGLYTPLQVLGKVIPETEKAEQATEASSAPSKGASDDVDQNQGVDGLVVKLAQCCNPIPGDKIFGFITRGRGLTVHVEDCPNVHTYDEQRKIEVSWELNKDLTYPVKLRISGDDRKVSSPR